VGTILDTICHRQSHAPTLILLPEPTAQNGPLGGHGPPSSHVALRRLLSDGSATRNCAADRLEAWSLRKIFRSRAHMCGLRLVTAAASARPGGGCVQGAAGVHAHCRIAGRSTYAAASVVVAGCRRQTSEAALELCMLWHSVRSPGPAARAQCTLDIDEEEGDRAGWQVGHTAIQIGR
jgi:hypothetical protein